MAGNNISIFGGDPVLREKLLGPLADEIGNDLASGYRGWRATNAARAAEKTRRRLEATDSDEESWVAPRALVRILDEASWADGEVMSEYFGGVMASALSKGGVDDRGAAWASTLAGMATVDVHLHYLFYRAFRDASLGKLNLLAARWPQEMQMFFPAPALLRVLKRPQSPGSIEAVIAPALSTLHREGLVGADFMLANAVALAKQCRCEMTEAGVVVQPTLAGIQLYMWAHGLGRESPSRFGDPEVSFETIDDLAAVTRAQTMAHIRTAGPLPAEQIVVTVRISEPDADATSK